jgi:hypothetical protein
MRKLLLILVGLIVVVVLGVVAIAFATIDADLVRTSLEQQLSARLGQPVTIAAASARVYPRAAVELRDVAIGQPPAVQLKHVRLATGLRGLWSRTVSEAEIDVSGARVVLPLSINLGADGTSSGESSSAFTVTSIERISLTDVSVTAGRETVSIDLESSIEGDRLAVSRLGIRTGSSRLDASGELTSIAAMRGAFEAKTSSLDLDELMAIGSAMTAAVTSGAPASATASAPGASQMRLSVKLSTPAGTFSTYSFSNLSTTVEMVPGRLSLSPLAVDSFGGRFEGRVEAATAGPVPVLTLDGRLQRVDVPALLKASGAAGGITGTLGGTIALRATAADLDALLKSATGSLDLAISDGSLPGLEMVRTIVLAFGKPTGAPVEGSGSAFSRLGGSFSLADGVLRTETLTFASRDFDMSGGGAFHLFGGQVEGAVNVVLSRELTAQAGTDLRRYAQEDGRVIVPARIGGTLERPRVSLDLAAAARRAIGNEIQRRTKSFIEGLFKKK